MSPARRHRPRGKAAETRAGSAETRGQKSKREAGPDVEALERFLLSLGVDPRRDPEYGETAELAARFLEQRTGGLREELRPLRTIPYRGRAGETVSLTEIPVYGLCPHHLTPYFGEASVRYVPRDRVCGTGSLARIVRDLARIPRIQESLTQAIADQVERALAPHSVDVVVRARHLCVEMRGVEQRVQFVTEARRTARG